MNAVDLPTRLEHFLNRDVTIHPVGTGAPLRGLLSWFDAGEGMPFLVLVQDKQPAVLVPWHAVGRIELDGP